MPEITMLSEPPPQFQRKAKPNVGTKNNMEVSLNLIAVGSTQQDIGDRFVKLTKDTPSIAVGRSSKNPVKGLEPSRHNATFDCPIMSRDHARFEMVESPMGITLRDLGSTHGTFLRNDRLEPHKSYKLHSGEDITFGVEVTNGPQVHPAKTFRIFYSVKMTNQDPPKLTRGFRAPDYESFSDDSREASVQIMDTPVEAYDLVSTDESDYGSDDYEEEDESETDDKKHSSAVTTPDSKHTTSEEQDKERTLSISNHYGEGPFALDRSNASATKATKASQNDAQITPTQKHQPEVHNLESEDEEDYEPREHVQDSAATESAPSRPSPPLRPQHPLSAILNEQSSSFKENIAPDAHVVPETQPQDITSGEESSDGGDDALPLESEIPEDDVVDDIASPKSKGKEAPRRTIFEAHKPSWPYCRSRGFWEEDTIPSVHPSTLFPPYRRSPSPSDAAIPQRNFGPTTRNALKPLDSWSRPDTFTTSQNNNGNYPWTWSESWGPYGSAYCAAPFSPPVAPHVPETIQPLPFGFMESSDQFQDADSNAREIEMREEMRSVVDPFGWEDPSPNISKESVAPLPPLPTLLAQESQQQVSETSKPESTPPPQVSRLNIANLIHDSQNPQERRTLKRKADEIATDLVEMEQTQEPAPETLMTQSGLSTEVRMKETDLPEAQARDVTAQDNSAEPSMEELRIMASPEADTQEVMHELREPPRKKVKTTTTSPPSSSRLGGIAKFVTGAAVGAIGVLATIIATAPTSVQEEALREMMMA